MMIKDYLPTSLFGRTFLIVMLPVLLLQVAVSIVFLDRHWSKMTERLAFAVSGELVAIINQIENRNYNAESIRNIQQEAAQSLSLDVEYQEGKILPEGKNKKYQSLLLNPFDTMERDLHRQLHQKLDDEFHIINIPEEKRVTVHIQTDRGLLIVNIPEGRLFSSSSYIFLLWMVGLSLFLFAIAMVFLRNQIRPIYRLGIIAERLGRGIPVGKIKPSGAREVRQAAEAFINMQERINQYVQQRTTMLASVSHDLRTPLTRMKLQMEMLEETPDTKALRDDINDMERMIEGYLSFAKGDGGEEMQRIDFSDLLEKCIADARRLGLEVDDKRAVDHAIKIWAKPIALSRAFQNFISNAARYASKMSIDIRDVSSEKLEIIIEDNGHGISQEQREAVLKPFMRGEASRNQKTGGVGLGLTIANDIILSHGGDLTLDQSEMMGGLKIIVHLPL